MHPLYFKGSWTLSLKKLDFCIVYIYDILVAFINITDHVKHLEQVFKIIRDAGIVLSKKKMEIGKKYINKLREIVNDK